MELASELFETSIAWLRDNYSNFRFFQERDLVWTVQTHINEKIEEQELPYQVFNDYPMLSGKRRSLSTDLAILNQNGIVEVAVEFKYEPSHSRSDILPTKFPVVSWGNDGVGKDVERIHNFVDKGVAEVAYSIFIDEGSHFRNRNPHSGSKWLEWNIEPRHLSRVSVLLAQRKVSS